MDMIKLKHCDKIVGSINPAYIATISVEHDKTTAQKGEVENDLHYSGLRHCEEFDEYYFPGSVLIKTCSGTTIHIGTYDPFTLVSVLSVPELVKSINVDYFTIS